MTIVFPTRGNVKKSYRVNIVLIFAMLDAAQRALKQLNKCKVRLKITFALHPNLKVGAIENQYIAIISLTAMLGEVAQLTRRISYFNVFPISSGLTKPLLNCFLQQDIG